MREPLARTICTTTGARSRSERREAGSDRAGRTRDSKALHDIAVLLGRHPQRSHAAAERVGGIQSGLGDHSGSREAAIRDRRPLADSRGSLCSPKAGFGRIRLLPRRAAYGLSCELTQPATTGRPRSCHIAVGQPTWPSQCGTSNRRKADVQKRPMTCSAAMGVDRLPWGDLLLRTKHLPQPVREQP